MSKYKIYAITKGQTIINTLFLFCMTIQQRGTVKKQLNKIKNHEYCLKVYLISFNTMQFFLIYILNRQVYISSVRVTVLERCYWARITPVREDPVSWFIQDWRADTSPGKGQAVLGKSFFKWAGQKSKMRLIEGLLHTFGFAWRPMLCSISTGGAPYWQKRWCHLKWKSHYTDSNVCFRNACAWSQKWTHHTVADLLLVSTTATTTERTPKQGSQGHGSDLHWWTCTKAKNQRG